MTYKFSKISSKIPVNVLIAVDRMVQKIIQKLKESRIVKTILKKGKVRGLISLISKLTPNYVN